MSIGLEQEIVDRQVRDRAARQLAASGHRLPRLQDLADPHRQVDLLAEILEASKVVRHLAGPRGRERMDQDLAPRNEQVR